MARSRSPARRGWTHKKSSAKPTTGAKIVKETNDQSAISFVLSYLEGNLGAFFLTVLTPVSVALAVLIASDGGFSVSAVHFSNMNKLVPTFETFLGVLGWISLQAFFFKVLPGHVHLGQPQRHNGKSLPYKMNGLLAFILSIALVLVLVLWTKLFSAKAFIDNLPRLMTTATIFSSVGACVLWMFPTDKRVSAVYRSGNFFYDFWMGTELNPRLGEFDIKFFMESRPGMIGWAVVNLMFLIRQYEVSGAITIPMLLVNVLEGWYILDYFLGEEFILTTMDIMFERFGFMLFFGDLVFVPFTFSFHAWFLSMHTPNLDSWPWFLLCVGLSVGGFYLFRISNLEKHWFRTSHPSGKNYKSIQTKAGTRLLVSGWWGRMRHPNYTGDWIQGLGWCMLCGTEYMLPYWYAGYFAVILIHRAYRDDRKCREKYGEDWDVYCRMVPYALIPGVV